MSVHADDRRRVMTRAACALFVLLTLALTPAADAARAVKYSGTVVAIDLEDAVLILDEVGPWRVEQGGSSPSRPTPRSRASSG
jgi:hypothetical protein